ncbi:hypothetical protein [Candidatus Protochlamydia amoebophila]|uniref:Uncharacterized protein n=2 Tax=Candidatus Protochlamydia amoebophila TaxID=362787 RepID=Q6MCK8_PARUW|nr:hypothetical protein [Candidatus Protochlamydia amoebophila]KIC72004.1 hypothetical protein DB44_CS00060 [Candidatus Protochlamydia amoebophila]CAF23691.1 unnamed protein product [Candidatus Protochlamydia amoebophila UWE25]
MNNIDLCDNNNKHYLAGYQSCQEQASTQKNIQTTSLFRSFKFRATVTLFKIVDIVYPIFKIFFQVLECVGRYSYSLVNGLISIKTKFIGIDFHFYFNININYDYSNTQNLQNAGPERALLC